MDGRGVHYGSWALVTKACAQDEEKAQSIFFRLLGIANLPHTRVTPFLSKTTLNWSMNIDISFDVGSRKIRRCGVV